MGRGGFHVILLVFVAPAVPTWFKQHKGLLLSSLRRYFQTNIDYPQNWIQVSSWKPAFFSHLLICAVVRALIMVSSVLWYKMVRLRWLGVVKPVIGWWAAWKVGKLAGLWHPPCRLKGISQQSPLWPRRRLLIKQGGSGAGAGNDPNSSETTTSSSSGGGGGFFWSP